MQIPEQYDDAKMCAKLCTCIAHFAMTKNKMPALLVQIGDAGTGKTWRACGTARAHCADYFSRERVWFQPAHELHSLTAEQLADAKNASVMILDDVGARTSQGNSDRAFSLIDYRINKRLMTFVTMNKSDQAQTDDRAISRLRGELLLDYSAFADMRRGGGAAKNKGKLPTCFVAGEKFDIKASAREWKRYARATQGASAMLANDDATGGTAEATAAQLIAQLEDLDAPPSLAYALSNNPIARKITLNEDNDFVRAENWISERLEHGMLPTKTGTLREQAEVAAEGIQSHPMFQTGPAQSFRCGSCGKKYKSEYIAKHEKRALCDDCTRIERGDAPRAAGKQAAPKRLPPIQRADTADVDLFA